MPDELEVRFFSEPRRVMIRFKDEEKALAYQKKNSECTISEGKHNCHEVYLPEPENLQYIRASQSKHHLVFVFVDQQAAEVWSKRSVLGDSNKYKEAWIKQKWSEGELDQKLGLEPDNDDDVGKPLITFFAGGKR